MRRKAWLLLVIVPVGIVGYLLVRPSAPAPVSGGEPPKPVVDESAETRAVMARLKAQAEIAASAKPITPRIPLDPATVQRMIQGQGEVDETKGMAALQKLRTQMELEKQTKPGQKDAKGLLPKVAAITGDATGNGFQALIGDTLVSEGDTVQGYRVRAIRADSVEFEKDGQTCTQKVN
jgi:hypothetical protein